MNDRNELSEKQLESYLDGLLTGPERAEFEEALQGDPQLRERVQLQWQIDASLRRFSATSQPTAEQLAVLEARFTEARQAGGNGSRSRRLAIGLAAAASIAAAFFVWRPFGWGVSEPFFQPQPVAQIYSQTVEKGFTPYYKCDDAERFAEVFRRRQGRALQLLPLAAGTEMLGVSYPGGLSRNSTAMLCRVNGEPVIVLVDRASADRPEVMHNGNPDLQVFREERHGLVFYEVTPFDSARVIDSLVLASGNGKGN